MRVKAPARKQMQRSSRGRAVWAGLAAASVLNLVGSRAFAADHELSPRVEAPEGNGFADGVYGRFNGDTDLSLKLGGLISQAEFWGSLGASAHYYSLVGISADYANGLASDSTDLESLSVGVELRPLFLPRWALDAEHGPAWLDLTLDSLALGLGAYWADPGEGFGEARGIWLSIGIGVPLLGSADGPWLELRETRRFPDHDSRGEDAHDAFYVYFGWHYFADLRRAIR
jgi:hypothetical protein